MEPTLKRLTYSYMSGDNYSKEGTDKIFKILSNFPKRISDIPEVDLDLYFHCVCHLSYRIEGIFGKGANREQIIDGDQESFVKDQFRKSLEFFKGAGLYFIRWRIAFHALKSYAAFHIRDLNYGFEHSEIKEILHEHSILLTLSHSDPSGFVSLSRVSAMLCLMSFYKDREKLSVILKQTWDSFNTSMLRFSFKQNISKADELFHIAEAMRIIQFIALKATLLENNDGLDRNPPMLPSHRKHLPFTNSILRTQRMIKSEQEELFKAI